MGILDQLKKEADSKRSGTASDDDLKPKREEEYQQNLLPRMQKISSVLQEVVEYLGQLAPIEVKDYAVAFPQIGTLKQDGYKINTDGMGGFVELDKVRQVNLIYRLNAPDTFSYTVEGRLAGEQEIDNMRAQNLNVESRVFTNDRGVPATVLTVERKISVNVKFEVDYDNSRIKLFVNNHYNFANARQSFTASEITDEFLDEFVRYLIRKDKTFAARLGKRFAF